MHTFQLKLDKSQLEELSSDISQEFLGFVLIEAVQLTAQEFFLNAGELVEVDDAVYRCDDPDSGFDAAVQHLLLICSEADQSNGVMLPGEFHEYSSDAHEQICEKLSLALASIRDNNGITELVAINGLLTEAQYAVGYAFVVNYYEDRVVFSITPTLFV
jgi:hypothetical protein